jgi:3D (Asp-Asp-Asp) domain-containing protein
MRLASRHRFACFLRVAAILSALASNAGLGQPLHDDFSFPAPTDHKSPAMNLWATHYFVYSASEIQIGVPLRDKTGQPLTGQLSAADWCLGAIEGTIQVTSGGHPLTLNYAGKSNDLQVDCASIFNRIDPVRNPWVKSIGKSYFTPARGPYGDGVRQFILVPFRTVAVDRNQIHYRTVLFIPEARGVEIRLSSGATIKHDGYFFAGDTGGALTGTHIDVFCGTSSSNCFPTFISSTSSKTFQAFVIDDARIKTKLIAIHTR